MQGNISQHLEVCVAHKPLQCKNIASVAQKIQGESSPEIVQGRLFHIRRLYER